MFTPMSVGDWYGLVPAMRSIMAFSTGNVSTSRL